MAIVKYVTICRDRVRRLCPGCDREQTVYVAETDEGERITCCCTCQTILAREKVETSGC
jgi:hypothetical protein